jgi:hypothetical protein
MIAHEFADPAREPFRRKPRRYPQPQPHVVLAPHQVLRGQGDLGQRGADPGVIGAALLRQVAMARAAAVDQRHAGPLFQRVEVPADGGVIDRKRRRRPSNAAARSHRLERAQRRKRRSRCALRADDAGAVGRIGLDMA